RRLSSGYIWLVRGTPLLVQLFISYFVLATLLNRLVGFEMVGAFAAALIALVVNTTAYNAETLRGGINSVERGQWDAAASIGMTWSQTMKRVILPQALRNSLPSLGNNLVVLIKDTSLVGAITLIELTYSARNVVFQTGQAFLPFVLAAAFYLAIISAVSVGTRVWERHLQRARQPVNH
ncbi:MAG: amino acid ABC transporter permease, partial [Armatimonadetes bacterium]|nr:amino acid ABC transporter permease [Armatimonadota bacterium]